MYIVETSLYADYTHKGTATVGQRESYEDALALHNSYVLSLMYGGYALSWDWVTKETKAVKAGADTEYVRIVTAK